MIGIYKITNLNNGKVYIGKSKNLENRWKQHVKKMKFSEQEKWHNQLYFDMHDIGIDNFSFEIIEECSVDKLNDKEIYWIKYYNSQENGYNIVSGGNYSGKLSPNDVEYIIQLLYEKILSIDEIADIYNVSGATIRSINRGSEFYKDNIQYPIRTYEDNFNIHLMNHNIIKSKNYNNGEYFCPICGKEITNTANMCRECYNIRQRKVKDRPSKEELSELIKTKSFVEVGKMYGVSDNSVRHWCKSYNLPYRKKDIKI